MWNPIEAAQNFGEAVVDAGDAVVDAAYDSYQSLTGDETQSQQQNQAAVAEARRQAQQEQAALDRQQHGIDVKDYDPPSITQHDNWDNWSHERLYGFRDTLKVEDVTAKGQAVEQLGADLHEIFAGLESEAREAAGDGWQGQGAEAALTAARPVQDWGTKFGDAMKLTGLKVQETATTAEQTKASIQPPPEFSTTRRFLGNVANVATGGAYEDAALREQERQEAAKAARAVAKNVYTPGYNSVDSSTPALPPPVNPVNPPPPPPGAGAPGGVGGGTGGNVGTYGGGGYGGSGSGSGSGGGYGGGYGGSGSGGSGPNAPGSNAPGTPGNYGPGTPGGNGPGTPAGNESAWTNPPPQSPAANMPPRPGATPSAPGAPGGSGSGYGAVAGGAPGTGGGTGGRGNSTPSPGGRSGSGPTGRNSGATPAPSASNTSNTSGRAGRMPMGGMGQNQGGGDEEEHERPTWLQEWDDVWLNDMPRTAPPVIE